MPVERVQAICDPFETPPWDGCATLRREDVARAVSADDLLANPYSLNGMLTVDWSPADHARRIAHLAEHGWEDAIEVDVGIPFLAFHVDWPVIEGNHRLAAAIYRGDEFITASVGGDLDYAFELFGVDCEETEAA